MIHVGVCVSRFKVSESGEEQLCGECESVGAIHFTSAGQRQKHKKHSNLTLKEHDSIASNVQTEFDDSSQHVVVVVADAPEQPRGHQWGVFHR